MADSNVEPHSKPISRPDSSSGRRVLLNTGAMAGSSLWRIMVSFVLQLFVVRMLGFAALGQYTVALACLNVCQILTELGLQNLLVRDLAQNPGNRRRYLVVSLRLQLLAAFLIWGLLWLVIDLLPYSNATRTALSLVGASLPFYAVTIACQTIFQAAERMDLVMVVELVINTLIGLFSIVALLMQGTVAQLIGILIGTQAASALLCFYLLRKYELLAPQAASIDVPSQDNRPALNAIHLLKEALPFYGLALADVLLQRLDVLLLSTFGGDLITGIYSAAYNVVRIFLKLIQSFWKALYPTLSRLAGSDERRYQALCQSSLGYGLLVILFTAAISMGGAGFILNLIYSGDANESVPVYQVLIWSAPLFLIELYALTLLMAEGRPYHSLLTMGVHLLAVCILLPILASLYDTAGAAWSVLIATAIGTVVSVWLLRRFDMPFKVKYGTRLLVPTIFTVTIMTLLPLAELWLIVSGIILYLALSWLCGIVTLKDFQTLRSML